MFEKYIDVVEATFNLQFEKQLESSFRKFIILFTLYLESKLSSYWALLILLLFYIKHKQSKNIIGDSNSCLNT